MIDIMSDYYNKYPNKKEIMELKARICGYEKANRDQGFMITSLRNEVAELKAENKGQSRELLKYVTGAVSYNEEIYQRGLTISELKSACAQVAVLLDDMKIYIDTVNDDADRRKMHKRIDWLLNTLDK